MIDLRRDAALLVAAYTGKRGRGLTMALQPIPARVTVSVGCIMSEARRAG